ncbi:flagellar hook-length control protein FliK [Pistricoccus aurantiacus]|uniref:flagellar hook-length control protein FliK n=1 Tax=Pistricoccus aurantiacus TaxID=1883414 RepID=UPI00364222E8
MDIKLLPVILQSLPSSGAGASGLTAADGSFARLIGAATNMLPQEGLPQDGLRSYDQPRGSLPRQAGLAEAASRQQGSFKELGDVAALNHPSIAALENRSDVHLDRLRNDPPEDQPEKDTDEPLMALIAMAQAMRPLDSAKALKPAMQEPLAVKQHIAEIKGQALPARDPLIQEIAGEMAESEAANETPDRQRIADFLGEPRQQPGTSSGGALTAQILTSQVQAAPSPPVAGQATSLNAARPFGDGAIPPAVERLEENLEGFDQLLDKAGSTNSLSRQDGTAAPLQGTGAAMSASGQAASPTITAPLQSPQWSQQLGQHLIALTQRGDQQMELRLNPEELGPLSVTLKLSDQGAQAHFLSGHAQVRGLIEQAIPQLRDALAQQGIALGETSVGDQGFQDNPRQEDGRRPGAGTRHFAIGENEGTAESTLAPRPVSRLDGRVDTYA